MHNFFPQGFFQNFQQFEQEQEDYQENEQSDSKNKEDQQNKEPEEVDNKKLYEVLEVNPKASQEEIKQQFKKLARIHHPDRGGSKEKFQEINAAYEVLSSPEKRKIYDEQGFEGLRSGNLGESHFGDIFDIFFGHHGSGTDKSQYQLKPIVVPYEASLEEIYQGKTDQLEIERSIVCKQCLGKGGEDPITCIKCKGQGQVIMMTQLSPGMYTQTREQCDQCQGKGTNIDEQKKCKECKGERLIKIKEKVEIVIHIGVEEGEKILIKEKGNEHYEYKTGDLVVIVKQKKHGVFKRVKNDLLMEKKISLMEALTEFQFNLEHINGMNVLINKSKQIILNNNSIMKVEKLGMPSLNNPMDLGDLYIKFEVVMPELISEKQEQVLREILPPGLLPQPVQSKFEYQLIDIKNKEDDAQKRKDSGRSQEEGGMFEEEEEENQGGQRVECSQQ